MEQMKIEEINSNKDSINAVRLIQEKVNRSQDIYDFKMHTLQSENEFLKNSFAVQSEHFTKLEEKVKEKVNALEKITIEKNEISNRLNEKLKENEVLKQST